jgi:hypothetical protein
MVRLLGGIVKTSPIIRDILYLDFDKAASIWSQFDEGLLERVSVTEDAGKDRAAGTKFGIPGVAEASLGVDYLQKKIDTPIKDAAPRSLESRRETPS